MKTLEDTYEIGMVIQERYLVEDILGKGGFSVVYLVRDQASTDEQKQVGVENRFALKMLTDREKQEKARFLFEGELLTRLHHHALPCIQQAFEDKDTRHACILMDYVEGINLDKLRKQQTARRFSLAEALAVLEPVVEALTYLHTQPAPIIHRDVKPSNLILRKDGRGAALVDFGIAKEYEPEATTTAIRHCSPGYGAPEQYSSAGTDQRTDIYGLAATLYTLLSGVVPADALQRATKLASKEADPLTPLDQLVPTLPAYAARAIQRAMSIGMDRRFNSVAEFWRALQDQDKDSRSQDGASAPTIRQRRVRLSHKSSAAGKMLPVWVRLAFAALVLLIVGGLAFGVGGYFGNTHGSGGAAASPHSAGRSTAIYDTHPERSPYPVVARAYHGTVHDLLANVTTPLLLARVAQNSEQISGSFSGLHARGTFTGVLDMSRHIYFTVSEQPSLYFQGAVRSDGDLVGNYCTVDAAGQCVGNYGVWSLAPVS